MKKILVSALSIWLAAAGTCLALTPDELSQLVAGAAMESDDAEVIKAVQVLVKKRFFQQHVHARLQGQIQASSGPVTPEKAREIATAVAMQKGDSGRMTFQRHKQSGADHYFLWFEEAEDHGPMTGPGRYIMVQVNIFGALVDVKIDSKPPSF